VCSESDPATISTSPGTASPRSRTRASRPAACTAYLVARGLAVSVARDVTVALVSALEGAFVLARTLRDTEPLLAVGRVLAPHFRGVALLPRVAAEGVGSAR
jgi:hypothetical protein